MSVLEVMRADLEINQSLAESCRKGNLPKYMQSRFCCWCECLNVDMCDAQSVNSVIIRNYILLLRRVNPHLIIEEDK